MIILLVDNKERDLPAMVKLSEKILSKYNTRVVISNYHEVDDIFEIERKKYYSVLFSYCKTQKLDWFMQVNQNIKL